MTDAEYEALKARLQVYIDKWLWMLLKFGWEVETSWHRYAHEGNRLCAAECYVKWEYLTCRVSFYLPAIQRSFVEDSLPESEIEERIERLVVHEYLHVLLNEMREDAPLQNIHHEERVAETLARVLLQLEVNCRGADQEGKIDPETPGRGAESSSQESEAEHRDSPEEISGEEQRTG